MASNFERNCFAAVLVLFSQILLSECIPVQGNGTVLRNAQQNLNGNKVPPARARILPVVKDTEGISYRLKNDERCKEDIEDFCVKESNSGGNYDLLLCLQNQIKEDELSEECHQAIWDYKSKLVHDEKFEAPAIALCKEDWQSIDECKALQPKQGDIVPCLVENKNDIQNMRCKHVVSKLAQILFTDYRLLKHFYKDCTADVKKFQCGRVDEPEKGDIHTQGSTLECLEDNEANLTVQCRHKVLRAAELQSDDYHMNRALYYACRDDREHFCATVEAGKGRVYACLMKKKFHPEMSNECRQKLTKKQKVESEDYKANFPFLKSCKAAIEAHKCTPKGGSPSQLAHVLLCLEGAINDGFTVSGTCQQHMKELQEELMEDYSINPAIVAKCEREIKAHCGKVEKGGKTLDCLMEKAMEKEGKDNKNEIEFSQDCYEAISSLLKETGAGGDFKVDATLRQQCQDPARKLCRDAKNDMGVLSCLMENLDNKDLGPMCREHLIHLQFFLARDFQLDEALYRACKDDAKDICGNAQLGDPDKDVTPQGMTLACLYRHILPNMNPDPSKKVSKKCVAEVMKTMHQRAADVRLLPNIQMSCISDLTKYCSDKSEPGEEIQCLQDNYENLQVKCKKSIGEFTEEESEDIDLDKAMVKHCSEMVKEFCSDLLKRNDADGILPCLYDNKYDRKMDHKCRAELEHRELIELKDYQFSSKFKKACRKDVQSLCQDSKTKPEVIECLSKSVRNAVVSEKEHEISDECRKQLKVEKLRQAEEIQFDPKLYGACANDVKTLCAHVHQDGPAAVLECLKQAEDDLSEECSRKIFEREKAEVIDAQLDVRLFKVCKAMIKKFCMDIPPNKVLHCLKSHKRDMAKDDDCRAVVFTRQKNALKNVELIPGLEKACHSDMSDLCSDATNNDQMIPCLKKHIKKLSADCEEFIVDLEKDAALDYRLNPSLAKACKQEINSLCGDRDPGHGEVMECLKEKYKKIDNVKCRAEIKEALIEERTDIMADPLLHEACSKTVTKHCDDISHGRGRILQCLMNALENGDIRERECRNVLKSRKEMWTGFGVPAPESLTDLASVVSSSPRRNYFFIVFSCALAIIFIGGLVSGRLTKRVAREAKNR